MCEVTYVSVISYGYDDSHDKIIIYAGDQYTSAVGKLENAVFPEPENHLGWIEHWIDGKKSWEEEIIKD